MKTTLKNLLPKLLLLALALPFVTACNDDDDTQAQADVTVQLENLINNQPLALNTTYTSPAGDTYQVQDFKYYISNVKLLGANGSATYLEPESYHLISETDGKTSFVMRNVPAGSYSRIEFSLGVDEEMNHRIDHQGDLDPSSDMVWDWDTGYKFLLLVGTYTGDTKSGGLVFHIGEDANYRTFTMDLQQPLDIRTEPDYTLHITTDLDALFQNPHFIDFDELNTAMGGENARRIVENYTQGFFTRAELR
ncbi:MAG: hypothetical protein LPK07_09680 [Hymenobacteraceae bacterium]|nr:hypothetical protein [Hymenobacteraceae bacterium]MDX5481941.1 hypothetical protein [Hymenobacteraceae bacterium]